MSFRWYLGQLPPVIEPHSKAKLDVLRCYLRSYFDRLNVNPQRDMFKLDLIDGFAGGGLFVDEQGSEVPGSPLIMLQEYERANVRLNEGRRKPLRIDCKFYFTDKEREHIDYLRRVLEERGHAIDDDRIVVRTSRFERELEQIINSVKRRQPRAGRAVFLLDQKGYSQVPLSQVGRIFQKLPTAEVILTFAADALVNYLAKTPRAIKMAASLELTETQIHDIINMRDGTGGRALIQRTLRDQIRKESSATYDTPFFIRPRQSRRALWILHLSRHPTARDVMIQQHWNSHNTFQHYGTGDFNMLGWDTLKDTKTIPLFNFEESDQIQMRSQLLEALPGELFPLINQAPVSIEVVRNRLANRTAAQFSDLDHCILEIVQDGEFKILNSDGGTRSRSLSKLQPNDRIALTGRQMFPGLSRLP